MELPQKNVFGILTNCSSKFNLRIGLLLILINLGTAMKLPSFNSFEKTWLGNCGNSRVVGFARAVCYLQFVSGKEQFFKFGKTDCFFYCRVFAYDCYKLFWLQDFKKQFLFDIDFLFLLFSPFDRAPVFCSRDKGD